MDLLRPNEDLLARVAEGDQYAFQILVNRHQTPVLNLIYRFLGDRQKSEDLAQETFFLDVTSISIG
jgi:RNA polymerase sigma-70 factor (ECF subfamily)